MALSTPSRKLCETFLEDRIESYEASHIWPSQVRIARRMLGQGHALEAAYDELIRDLGAEATAWQALLDCVLSTTALWDPRKIARMRAGRTALVDANEQIARLAEGLAGQLTIRARLHEGSGFTTQTHYHVIDVIVAAGSGHGRFESFVRSSLEALGGRFDLKYWPDLADVVAELGRDAREAQVSATDPLTAEATRSSRPSNADFVRALFESVDENRGDEPPYIPAGYRPSDAMLASFVNVVLELPPDRLIDAVYVKNVRHRDGRGQSR